MFNCQMGYAKKMSLVEYVSYFFSFRRGRTSTGMVITCLMEMIVGNSILIADPFFLECDSNENLVQDEDNRERYLQGEYKIILQLIAVLQYGKLSKKLTDKAIDICEHLQNLRSAIYDYKLRVDAAEPGSRKHQSLSSVGLNYLIRYFYLIVFADYLLEEAVEIKKGQDEMARPQVSFSLWLENRREITNIGRKSNQTFD